MITKLKSRECSICGDLMMTNLSTQWWECLTCVHTEPMSPEEIEYCEKIDRLQTFDERDSLGICEKCGAEIRAPSGVLYGAEIICICEKCGARNKFRRFLENVQDLSSDSVAMSLSEAIEHARSQSKCANGEKCRTQHKQLADWLEELRRFRADKARLIEKLSKGGMNGIQRIETR